jgi:hypothetical protein
MLVRQVLRFTACRHIMNCAVNLDLTWEIPNVLRLSDGTVLGLGDIAVGGIVCSHALCWYGWGVCW